MSSRSLAAISIFALTTACGDGQRATGPSQTEVPEAATDRSVMFAWSPTTVIVFPSQGDFIPPAVKIVRSRGNTPVAGIRVTFAFSNSTRNSVVTDKDGIARAERWQLDSSTPSQNVVATAEGVSESIKFTASVISKTPVAIYDLQRVGGKELPLTYGGGGHTWELTGGRYVLFDDGTYIYGSEIDGKQGWALHKAYIQREWSIEFYLDDAAAPASSFNPRHSSLFSTGVLTGDLMSVMYMDYYETVEEIYRARR